MSLLDGDFHKNDEPDDIYGRVQIVMSDKHHEHGWCLSRVYYELVAPMSVTVDGLTALLTPIVEGLVMPESPIADLKFQSEIKRSGGAHPILDLKDDTYMPSEDEKAYYTARVREYFLGRELEEWVDARVCRGKFFVPEHADVEHLVEEFTDRDYMPLPSFEILEKPHSQHFLAGVIIYSVLAHLAFIAYTCFHDKISLLAAL